MGNATSTPSTASLPLLSAQQVRELTQLLTTVYAIEFVQPMESTGWHLALLAKRLLDDDIIDRPIVILAGAADQCAGGLVAARYLLNWGAWVQLVLTQPVETHTGIAARQLTTLQAMGIPLAWAEEGWELPPADLIIDALLGGEPLPSAPSKVRDLIQLANSSRAPILSLVLPSGVDADSGQLGTPHIQATATMAVALPRTGVLTAQSACGDLYLADVGVPAQLYLDLALAVPLLDVQEPLLPLVINAESVAIA